MLGVDTGTLHGKAKREMLSAHGRPVPGRRAVFLVERREALLMPIRGRGEEDTMREIAALKVAMVGLPPDTGEKKPSELSGGMRKRASLARALASMPAPLPGRADGRSRPDRRGPLRRTGEGAFHSLGLTILMVTHDLDSLNAVCDRIAVLLDKRVVVGTMEELLEYDHPWVREYFHGPQGRAARQERK